VEDAMHILLKYPGTEIWRFQFLSDEWLEVKEEVTYRKTGGM
jgi:hypothetical protein